MSSDKNTIQMSKNDGKDGGSVVELKKALRSKHSASSWERCMLNDKKVEITKGLDWKAILSDVQHEEDYKKAVDKLKEHVKDKGKNITKHLINLQEDFEGNPFLFFFKRLQELRYRSTGEENSLLNDSTEEMETKAEKASEAAMHAFVETVKDGMPRVWRNRLVVPGQDGDRVSYMVMESTACHSMYFRQNVGYGTADTDGYLYMARGTKNTYDVIGKKKNVIDGGVHQTRYSKVPIVTLEAKRAKEEDDHLIAQEFCEMITTVQANMFGIGKEIQGKLEVREADFEEQEAFSISFMHTKLAIATVVFPARYQFLFLTSAAKFKEFPGEINIKKSRWYDLREEKERFNAVEALVALFHYITSGKAKIRKVQRVLEHVREERLKAEREKLKAQAASTNSKEKTLMVIEKVNAIEEMDNHDEVENDIDDYRDHLEEVQQLSSGNIEKVLPEDEEGNP